MEIDAEICLVIMPHQITGLIVDILQPLRLPPKPNPARKASLTNHILLLSSYTLITHYPTSIYRW